MNRDVRDQTQMIRTLFLVLAIAVAGVVATNASAGPASIGPLRMCVYFTVNDTVTTGNVKVKAAGAAGLKGAFVLKGNAANVTTHFKVRRNGMAFTSFAVPGPGGERVTVTLGSQTRTMNLTLPAGTNVKQPSGCTPT
jgi:hypothetical protein